MTDTRVLTKWTEWLQKVWQGPKEAAARLEASRVWFWVGLGLVPAGLLMTLLAGYWLDWSSDSLAVLAVPILGVVMMARGFWLVPADGLSAESSSQRGVRATYLAALGSLLAVLSLPTLLYYFSFTAALLALVLLGAALRLRCTWRRGLLALPGLGVGLVLSIVWIHQFLT